MRSLTPRQKILNYAVELFQRKTGRFSLALSMVSSAGRAVTSAHVSLKHYFFVCSSCGSYEHKHHWFSGIIACSCSGSPKIWGARCGVQNLFLMEKLGVRDFLPIVGCCAGSGVYGKSVSQPCLPVKMWAFSHLPGV